MGELVDLQGPSAGQFSLNDWYGQQDNAATPKGMVPAILPVQEMREFQRRYRISSAVQAMLIGERVVVTWTVPRNEWWRPLGIQWSNGDSVQHQVLVSASIDRSVGISSYQVVSTRVNAGALKIIYGVDLDALIEPNLPFTYSSRLPIVLEPFDRFAIGDSTSFVEAAGNVQWTFLYELVPQPATPAARGEAGAVVVT